MYRESRLENGIEVVTYNIKASHSVSVGFWFKVGSVNEDDREAGVAHFIEHMMFKGTKKRDAFQIARDVDNVGAYINAGTNREYTSYYIKIVSDKIKVALEILSDLVSNSVFAPEEIEKERQVVLEEIYMYEDSPSDIVHDNLYLAMFPSHPLGRPILGTVKTVSKFNRKNIIDFYKKYYVAKNLIISVAGRVNHNEVVDYIKEIQLFNKRRNIKGRSNYTSSFSKPENIIKVKDLSQVNFCLGFPGLKREDERRYALYVLNTFFGSSMSSRLFQEIREKAGLCYSIYSFNTLFIKNGLFGIYGGTNLKNLPFAIEKIISEIKKIKKGEFSEEDIHNAKEHLKGNMALSYESTDAWMDSIAKQKMFYGRFMDYKKIISLIDKVNKDKIMEVVDLIFPDGYSPVISSVGNKKHQKILNTLSVIL